MSCTLPVLKELVMGRGSSWTAYPTFLALLLREISWSPNDVGAAP